MGTLIDYVVFGVIATGLMYSSYKEWQANTEEELLTRWLRALVATVIGSQLLYWFVPRVSLDWMFLFRNTWPAARAWYSNLYYLALGLFLFFLIRFVLAGGMYLLFVRIFSVKKQRFGVRWFLFLGSFFAIEYPLQWFLPDFYVSYFEGVDDLAIALLQPQNGIVVLLVLLLAALTLKLTRAETETTIAASWEAWIPALFAANLAYLHTQSGWLAAMAFGFLLVWTGQRLPRIIQQPRKISRFLYWVLFDIPGILVIIGSWALWEKGWLTALLGTLAILFFDFGIMSGVLMKIFPIVGRQEWMLLIQPNTAQKAAYDDLKREVTGLEKEELRKRTLRKLQKQEKQLIAAESARLAGNVERALHLLDEIINSLSQITSLIAAQKQCFGKAYQCRAKIYVAQSRLDAAHSDVTKAQKYIQPDLELVGGIADLAASKNYNQTVTFKYCIDYLGLMRGKPADKRFQRIQAYLERFCLVGPGTSSDQATRIQQIASQVLAVDPGAAWACRAQGQAGIVLGQWDQALDSLEKAVQLSPQDRAAQFSLGQAYQHQNRHSDARQAYEAAYHLDETQSDAAHALGCLLLDAFGKEDLKSALKLLRQAASDAPQIAVYQYDWGRACIALDDWKNAQTAFERALKIEASSIPARRALANLLYQRSEWEAALPHFEILYGKNPEDAELQICLGRCLLETGSAERAARLVSSQAAEGDAPALLVLGRSHLRLGEYDLAVEELRRRVSLQGQKGEALYYLGCAYAWLGATKDPSYFKNALQSLEKAEEADESLSARASLQMGHIYLRQDRLKEAIRCYRGAAADAKLQLSAGLALARAYMADGQVEEADQTLSKLKKHGNAEVQYVSGIAAEMRGDLASAEQAYRQTEAFGSLGVILYKQGKTQEARSALQQARKRGDNSDRVLYYAGLCQIETGNFEQGIDEWETLSKRHPESGPMKVNLTRAWYQWGCDLYQHNKYADAAKAWEPLMSSGGGNEDLSNSLQQLYLLAASHETRKAEKERLLQRASELGAERSLIDTILAIGQLTECDLQGAFSTLAELVKKNPRGEIINYNLGVVLLALSKGREAVEHFICARDSANDRLSGLAEWGLVAALGSAGQWQEAAKILAGSME